MCAAILSVDEFAIDRDVARHHGASTARGDGALADRRAWKPDGLGNRRRHRRDVAGDQSAALRVDHFRYATPSEGHDGSPARQCLGDDQAVRLVPERGHQRGSRSADQRRQSC